MANVSTLVRAPSMTSDDGLLKFGANMSPSVIVTAAVGLLMLLGFITFKSKSFDDILPGVPEYKGLPFLGATPILLKHGMPHLLEKLIAIGEGGISYANVANSILISVHDPAMVREVLSYSTESASRDGDSGLMSFSPFETLRRMIGNSLFNTVGPEASHHRNVFIREFNNTKSNSEKFDTVEEMSTAHINTLTGEESTAKIDDFTHSTEKFAVSLWGEILYGNPNYHVGGHVLSLAGIILKLAGDPWPPIWYFFQLLLKRVTPGEPTRSEAKLRKEVSEVIEKSIGKLEKHERDNPDAPLKVIRKLSVMTGGGRTGPLSRFASEFTNLNLFGGHHSMGSIITWSLIELDRHPECLVKLMAEIDSADTTDFTTINSKMPYLDAVVMEVNRLYPVVHATVRVINRDTRLASSKTPVVLKPGMLVYLSYLNLQTSPRIWGVDAKVFDPQKFLDGHIKEQPFMPFGYGPRSCVGYQFAILVIKVYLVRLLETYRVDVQEHDHDMKIGTLVETTKPVAVKLSRRFSPTSSNLP